MSYYDYIRRRHATTGMHMDMHVGGNPSIVLPPYVYYLPSGFVDPNDGITKFYPVMTVTNEDTSNTVEARRYDKTTGVLTLDQDGGVELTEDNAILIEAAQRVQNENFGYNPNLVPARGTREETNANYDFSSWTGQVPDGYTLIGTPWTEQDPKGLEYYSGDPVGTEAIAWTATLPQGHYVWEVNVSQVNYGSVGFSAANTIIYRQDTTADTVAGTRKLKFWSNGVDPISLYMGHATDPSMFYTDLFSIKKDEDFHHAWPTVSTHEFNEEMYGAPLDFTTDKTIIVRANKNTPDRYNGLLLGGNFSTNEGVRLDFQYPPDDQMTFAYYDTDGSYNAVDIRNKDYDNWFTLAITLNSTTGLVEFFTTHGVSGSTTSGFPVALTTGNTIVGNISSNAFNWKGFIDAVLIWQDEILDPATIATEMTLLEDPYVLLFRADDGTLNEINSLVELYNMTKGANWTAKTNWLTDTTLNNWSNVTTDGTYVTRLEIDNNNLEGDISEWKPPARLTHFSLRDEPNLSFNWSSYSFKSSIVDWLFADLPEAVIDVSQFWAGDVDVETNLEDVILVGCPKCYGALEVGVFIRADKVHIGNYDFDGNGPYAAMPLITGDMASMRMNVASEITFDSTRITITASPGTYNPTSLTLFSVYNCNQTTAMIDIWVNFFDLMKAVMIPGCVIQLDGNSPPSAAEQALITTMSAAPYNFVITYDV